MSDPVGNSPRRTDVPNNSVSNREAPPAKAPQEEREQVEKVIKGQAVTRKTPWYKKMTRSIFAEDLSTMGEYFVTDLVIPTIRNALYEVGSGLLTRGIWGAKAGIHRPGGPGSSIVGGSSIIGTRYDKMSEGSRVISREARARHDFQDVLFDHREEAIAVLEGMVLRIERYRFVSVHEFYTLCGVTGDWAAQKWGWTDLNSAVVRQRYGKWLLDLPEPEPIRN